MQKTKKVGEIPQTSPEITLGCKSVVEIPAIIETNQTATEPIAAVNVAPTLPIIAAEEFCTLTLSETKPPVKKKKSLKKKKKSTKKRGRKLKTIASDIIAELAKHDSSGKKLGVLLLEAKAKNGEYGNWEDWLNDNFGMSLSTARRLIRIARGIAIQPTLADFEVSKIDLVLRLPTKDRETFIAENNVAAMGVRDLEKLVKARKGKKVMISTKSVNLNNKVESFEKRIDDFFALFKEYPRDEDSITAQNKFHQLLAVKAEEVKNFVAERTSTR